MQRGNLYAEIPATLTNELFETLLATAGFRLERIVTRGQVTPAGQWYDEADNEWVLLLQGAAELEVEGEAEPLRLRPGEWVHIPAHCRHRVQWTDPEGPTVWLALHYSGEGKP